MLKLSVIVAIVALGIVSAQTNAGCGVCQDENEVYCQSETEYYLCMDGKTLGEPESCPTGTVCTNDNRICVEQALITGSIENVCASAGSCQKCSAGQKYTCVSSNQAGRCVNEQISSVINCKADEICVAEAYADHKTVCVPKCAASFVKVEPSCINDDYTTTTLSPPPTPGQNDLQEICKEASTGITTTWFYTYHDSTCNSYVYCQRSSLNSQNWDTTSFGRCTAPKPYFDTKLRECVAAKSTSCLAYVPVSTTPVTPTNAPSTPTNAPVTPTNAPVTPTNAPVTPTTDAPTSPSAPTTSV